MRGHGHLRNRGGASFVVGRVCADSRIAPRSPAPPYALAVPAMPTDPRCRPIQARQLACRVHARAWPEVYAARSTGHQNLLSGRIRRDAFRPRTGLRLNGVRVAKGCGGVRYLSDVTRRSIRSRLAAMPASLAGSDASSAARLSQSPCHLPPPSPSAGKAAMPVFPATTAGHYRRRLRPPLRRRLRPRLAIDSSPLASVDVAITLRTGFSLRPIDGAFLWLRQETPFPSRS
jgi:hypothetical protein